VFIRQDKLPNEQCNCSSPKGTTAGWKVPPPLILGTWNDHEAVEPFRPVLSEHCLQWHALSC
jgi:hypothetical protein